MGEEDELESIVRREPEGAVQKNQLMDAVRSSAHKESTRPFPTKEKTQVKFKLFSDLPNFNVSITEAQSSTHRKYNRKRKKLIESMERYHCSCHCHIRSYSKIAKKTCKMP